MEETRLFFQIKFPVRIVRRMRLFLATFHNQLDINFNIICSFTRKEFESCSLFRNLLFVPFIAENPVSHFYDEKKTSVLL